jgi:ribosome modulation factor
MGIHNWVSAAASGYRTSTRKCSNCGAWEDDDIVTECREAGRIAKSFGIEPQYCPYNTELERVGWLDGWSRAPDDGSSAAEPASDHPDPDGAEMVEF